MREEQGSKHSLSALRPAAVCMPDTRKNQSGAVGMTRAASLISLLCVRNFTDFNLCFQKQFNSRHQQAPTAISFDSTNALVLVQFLLRVTPFSHPLKIKVLSGHKRPAILEAFHAEPQQTWETTITNARKEKRQQQQITFSSRRLPHSPKNEGCLCVLVESLLLGTNTSRPKLKAT